MVIRDILLISGQIYRVAEIGRYLSYVVQPLCSKQGWLELVAQGHVKVGFQYLQGWRLGNLLQCLTTLRKKNEFLIFSEFSCVSVCAHCHFSLHGKSL